MMEVCSKAECIMDHLSDFSKGDVVKVHTSQLSDFKKTASGNQVKRRYRLCLQDSPSNKLQDMLICRTRGDYYRPDKHGGIPETHTIIDGREEIVLFSDNGEIVDVFTLDRADGHLCYRVNSDIFHMTVVLSEFAIDHEVKPGPFTNESNIYPIWAPDGSDPDENERFLKELEQRIRAYKTANET